MPCRYLAERDNPDSETREHYATMGESMWVTLINLTGEAPLCDYTLAGRFVVSFMMLVGVGVVTIPMGIFGAHAGYTTHTKGNFVSGGLHAGVEF